MYTAEQEKHLYHLGKTLLLNDHQHEETQIERLREIIHYADWKYYVQSEPAFADAEYDGLFRKLKDLESKFPEQITDNSPTQRVATGLSEKFPPVAHLVPMLSLDNTYNAEDLREWERRCREYAQSETMEYCVEPKYDGASISLIYEHGKLTRGATRGDGVMGEDITANIRQIRSIPLSAPFSSDGITHMEIRGEVVIHKAVFAGYNEQRAKQGLTPLANPRNAASGTLRILDPDEVRKRKLSAILYHISDYAMLTGKNTPQHLNNHYDSLNYLYQLGFPTPIKEMKRFSNIDAVIDFCKDFESRRDELPYEVDGLVIKINAFELQEKMGMTAHHPRWAVAYKFKARQGTSKLRRVEFQVGRTGTITPVAKIDPVQIGGVTVSSVSLFNEDIVREKDLHIGDTVLVERAGDVIPYIVKPITELRDGTEFPIIFPKECPDCRQPLEKPEEEAVWRCINISCPSQVVERLIHFCSKDAMDIRGMGAANVKKFYDMKLLTDIPGLYHIDWTIIRTMGGFGSKSVTNLQTAVERSKTQSLNRVIYGLGIRHVGETMAKTLAQATGHLKEFYTWTEEQYLALDDVGPKVAAAVADFFKIPENRHMLDELEQAGLTLTSAGKDQHKEGNLLNGKTFLFTGTLNRMKRSEAEKMAEDKGGVIVSGVSSKLNYLVVGDDAGSKLEKAKKLGTVTILSEERFLSLISS